MPRSRARRVAFPHLPWGHTRRLRPSRIRIPPKSGQIASTPTGPGPPSLSRAPAPQRVQNDDAAALASGPQTGLGSGLGDSRDSDDSDDGSAQAVGSERPREPEI